MQVLSHFLKWRFGLANAETQTTDAERACIARHAAGKYHLVEIGVWHAVTTTVIRAAMEADGTLYAVDPFPRGRLGISLHQIIAHSEGKMVKRGEIKWIRALGKEAFDQARGAGLQTVDFIFIDGDHSFEGIRIDWQLWSPVIVPGGIVALHDSRSTATRDIDQAGSVLYTKQHISQDNRFELIDEVDSLTVLRRRLE